MDRVDVAGAVCAFLQRAQGEAKGKGLADDAASLQGLKRTALCKWFLSLFVNFLGF